MMQIHVYFINLLVEEPQVQWRKLKIGRGRVHISVFMLVVSMIVLFLLLGPRNLDLGTFGDAKVLEGDHRTLVVFGPPLGGRTSRPELERLVREAYPSADFLAPTYEHSWFSNIDPYELTSHIEQSIRAADDKFHYEKIILFGYSTGGLLLRKAYVWGYGLESDRPSAHGRHPWVDRVDRFVSLAAPNRGWPSEKSKNLRPDLYAVSYVAQQVARVTGTGRFIASLLQGSPFVANMRVQWIDLFSSLNSPGGRKPLIIHLVGDKDELVDREDSIDLEAGTGSDVIIKTLEGLSHDEIATLLFQPGGEFSPAGEAIHMALTSARDRFPAYWPDKIKALQTDPEIKQLIFVMHGIRDESTWPAEIKRAIERQIGDRATTVKIIPPLYRRFAMLPFLLYWDRQYNVRWFMDEYTQAKAKYPNLQTVDYIGHSNGTYILASALQQYPVLKVRNVLFAGSVVPMHYNWGKPIAEGRVTGRIWNVCAASDWVVAIFPQFFQQLSDWLGIEEPKVGILDIGSAGFRGFRTQSASNGRLFDVKYISGTHGAAFETSKTDRANAIAAFVTSDPRKDLNELREPDKPGFLVVLSNLSWMIWIAGFGIIGLIGVLAFRFGWPWLLVYIGLLVGVLTTV